MTSEKGREVEVLVRVRVYERGREEPPLSEGGSHWRVTEKGMRSTTRGFSGIVGGTALETITLGHWLVKHRTSSTAHHSQTGSE